MTQGIYKITSPSGKIYIGQSLNIQKRWREYKCALAKGQPLLNNSFKKHGFDSHIFEVIHEVPTATSMDDRNKLEILYWTNYKNRGFEMLNIREPGGNGKLSESTKRKMSETKKGKPSKLRGVPKPKESILKSMATRRERGNLGLTGKTPWNKGIKTGIPLKGSFKKGHVSWNRGKPHSEEVKLKLKEAWVRRKLKKNKSCTTPI